MTARATSATSATKINGRMPKAKAKPTVTQPVEDIEIVAAHTEEPDTETLYQRAKSAMEDLVNSAAMPSWVRRVVSTLTAITASACATYGTLALFDMITLAVFTYTASNFLAFVVAFIGLVLALMAAVTTATRVFEFCMNFEASRVATRVKGWFTREPKPATA